MATIYLLDYMNYSDRIIKWENTLSGYQKYLSNGGLPDENGNSPVIENVNFDPGNGVNTFITVNWAGKTPNYLLVVEGEKITPWFVMDEKYQNFGQTILTLRKDVIAENRDEIKTSSSFIERGTPLTKDDTAIFNNEACTYNQIKSGEYPIKDEFGCPWALIYVAQNYKFDAYKDIQVTGTIIKSYSAAQTAQNQFAADPVRPYTAYGNEATPAKKIKVAPKKITYNITVATTFNNKRHFVTLHYNKDRSCVGYEVVPTTSTERWPYEINILIQSVVTVDGKDNYILYAEVLSDLGQKLNIPSNYWTFLSDTQEGLPTQRSDSAAYANYTAYENGLVEYKNSSNASDVLDIYYEKASNTIDYYETYSDTFPFERVYSLVIKTQSLYSPDSTRINQITVSSTSDSKDSVTLDGTYDYLIASSAPIGYTIKISQSSLRDRIHCGDQPYDVLAVPLTNVYSDIVLTNTGEYSRFIQMNVILHLVAELGEQNIYDVQIVPYCPCRQYFQWTSYSHRLLSTINVYTAAQFNAYDASGTLKATCGIGLWLNSSKTSFNISSPLLVDDYLTITDKKMANETDMYRICSPGYSGVMEFSVAKNGGLTSFNVDMLATPFTPYIQVSPDFGGLYGRDYNDMRGMVSGDDLSLPQASSAWTNYKVANKNYQQAFDRSIENIELHNAAAKIRDTVGAVTGTIGGAINGMTGGAMAGSAFGPWGALIGGAIGGVAGGISSGIAGGMDLKLNEMERREDVQYQKDMFRMQMENIQALPYTLNKGSILTPTFKYFPFIEYYTCSEEEKMALKYLIKYQGMRIERFGNIAQYLNPDNPYIQGFIVRYSGKLSDNILSTINKELRMGVYLYGTDPIRS